jgi:hypothetical protein
MVSGLIIYWSGWDTLQKLGWAILIGYGLIALNFLFKLNPHMPRLDWRSAQWLPVYLVGMGIVSWKGRYCANGPASITTCGATNSAPMWWDLIIVAGFSLIIYYWALAVRLPDDETLAYIGDVNAQIGATAETAPEDISGLEHPTAAGSSG